MPKRPFLSAVFAAVLGSVVLAGCNDGRGHLDITNESGARADISAGDIATTIDPYGGVSVLDSGCTTGDVTIKLSTGEVLTVPGPVCPPDAIVIHDGSAEVVSASPDK